MTPMFVHAVMRDALLNGNGAVPNPIAVSVDACSALWLVCGPAGSYFVLYQSQMASFAVLLDSPDGERLAERFPFLLDTRPEDQ